jgi:2-keto-4-pentenoate hydratase/2-oxohepta-3-ene-1,7-dioic acid hydratase in catechol pathway
MASRGRSRLAERRTSSGLVDRRLIFPIEHLVQFITFVMTLQASDVISTGTSGIGSMKAGDVVTVKVEGVGELSNPVEAEI